jgi:hypothetical protein
VWYPFPRGPDINQTMGLFKKHIKPLVRVHKAYFTDMMDLNKEPYYFVNILNIDPKRNITIDKVWYVQYGGWASINQPGRDTPVMLTPGEQWETWIQVQYVGENAFKKFFADIRFERSKYWLFPKATTVSSTKRINVPPFGTVPGGL